MSINQNFPATWPSLVLDFANSKTLDPRVTFTRASTGTYVGADGLVKTAAADEPRFNHNPSTGESLGLLIEESRTNFARFSGRPDVNWILDVSGGNGLSFIDGEIVTSSSGGLSATYVEELSSSTQIVVKLSSGYPAGVLTGATSGATRNITSQLSPGGQINVSATITNEVVSPDGTQNALLVAPTTTGSQLRLVQKTYTTSTAGTYTFSIFFKNKNISNNTVAIRLSNQTATADVRANFVLSTKSFQTVGTVGGWTGSVGYQEYPNDWIRLWVTGTTLANTHTLISGNFWLGGYQGTAETNGSLYVWESQIETGAFPTSQIQTTYSTATRNPDNVSMTGENFSEWYNPIESTFFATFRQIYNSSATVPPSTKHVLQAGNDTTVNDNYTIRAGDTSTTWTALIRSASPSSLQFPGLGGFGYLNSSTLYKAALSVNSSLISISLNGLLNADTTNTTTVNHSTTFNKLFIGSGTGGSPPFELSGHIAQIIYYPFRVSNSQLQNLTK